MNLDTHLSPYPRVSLLDGATPLQRLTRLEQQLNSDVAIYVKRDDCMGLGLGGNKLRKLEFLMGEARAQGCDTFITTGGLQSNHARLTAAAAARAGMACELVLARMVARDELAYTRNGNMLLDQLFGATIHTVDADPLALAQERARALAEVGRKAYVVGLGGSSPLGSLGYVACAAELVQQEQTLGTPFSRIVIPTGSFGTHGGLAAGLQLLGADASRLQAFSVLAQADAARTRTAALVGDIFALLQQQATPDVAALHVDDTQLGAGYGIPTPEMVEAVRLLARAEGLVLDPVYSGKAFAGLLAMIRQGEVPAGASVLFLMTGGTPGLFAYQSVFDEEAV